MNRSLETIQSSRSSIVLVVRQQKASSDFRFEGTFDPYSYLLFAFHFVV